MIDSRDNHFLWVEKYRPQKIDECVLPEALKKTFKDYIAQGNLPTFLFSGTAGVGKTTVAKALCAEVGAEYIMINGSEEGRSIDTLRTTINGNSGPVDNVQFWYSTTSTTNFNTLLTVYGADGGTFVANQNVQGVVTGLANNTYYFKARVGLAGLYSPLSTTSTSFAWNPAYDYGGI